MRSEAGLTPKQEAFVREYLIDLNATAAYIRAGYVARGNAAEVGAFQLIRNPKVAAAIAVAKAERSARVQIDADWVMRRLGDTAEADLGDLYDDNGALRPIHLWPKIWRQGLVAGVEIEELYEGYGRDREHVGRVRKVKLADRVKVIELLGRHVDVQAFKDRVEHDVTADLAAAIAAGNARVLGS